jgi:hypothetical protein
MTCEVYPWRAFAAERVGTALLVTGGLSIVIVDNGDGIPILLVGPCGYGILMISLGRFALLLATVQHRQSMKMLQVQYPEVPRSLAALFVALISALGILALIAAIFRE